MQLLFGIRASGDITLTVTATGDLPVQLPDLRVKTAGQDIAIDFSNGAWVASVAAGDSIVYVAGQGDSCVMGPLAFTLSAPATIITASVADSPISWTATAGATAAIGANDVKNPWPPPDSAQTTPLAEPGWIGSTLGTMGAQAATLRSSSSQAPAARTGRQDNYR